MAAGRFGLAARELQQIARSSTHSDEANYVLGICEQCGDAPVKPTRLGRGFRPVRRLRTGQSWLVYVSVTIAAVLPMPRS